MLLGMIDIGRAMMVGEVTAGAARVGARAAAVTGAANNDVAAAVAAYLGAGGISNAATTISVNGVDGADLANAATGDSVKVSVQAPMDSNSWLPSSFFGARTISGVAVFVKE